MNLYNKYIGSLFVTTRFYLAMLGCILIFVIAFYIPVLEAVALLLFLAFVFFVVADYIFLFINRRVPLAKRTVAPRLSNGEENAIEILIRNKFPFPIHVRLIDELPAQLQIRDWSARFSLKRGGHHKITWQIKPTERGDYHFGDLHLFVSTPLRLIIRRLTVPAAETVSVYPAFSHLHQYEILSNATLAHEQGSRRVRKIGQSMEFEQIREYVSGDDIRKVNWKASARRRGLMVNSFMEERSQQVYCIIDKGRLMKMPFDGLTLLDYAINSTLTVSRVCLKKQDRAGVMTFSHQLGSVVAADRKPAQSEMIMQALYRQQTDFLESDFEMLYREVRAKIRHRSLLILFTNFESLSGLHRQVNYLRAIAKYHLLLVVFFENTELTAVAGRTVKNVEDVYIKTIAEKFAYEKRLIHKELSKYGIMSLLTTPKMLTINTINKYLEIKTRQAL